MNRSAAKTTIEMPALGRPFSLGMLYDCRNDELIPGITLWNSEALRENVALKSQEQTSFEIITSDTVSDKSSAMNINASLEASFLCGLVSVSGSATYMNDTKRSKNQARVTLKYSRTTRFEQLTMNHLGTKNMAYPDVFDKGTATHVVTGILYGAQAFFIFDRDVSTSENTQDIQGTLHIMIKKIPSISVEGQGSLTMNDKEKEQVSEFSCKFYGDFALDRNPVTYEDAIAIYSSLPKLLGEKGDKAVPVRVWLYPLNKLDSKAAQLVRDISKNLVLKAESVVQQMAEVNMQCNDLMRHPIAETFPDIKKKITKLSELCEQFKLIFQKQLVQTLPSIRGGGLEEHALADILTSVEQSPFGKVHIEEFFSQKQQELNVVKTYMEALPNVRVSATECAINEVVLDHRIQYVVCYNLSSLNEKDPYLCDMNHWLLNNKDKSENNGYEKNKVIPWFKVTDISKKTRTFIKVYKKFAMVNTSNDKLKFIISSVPDQSNPGVSIYLYDSGELVSSQFEPPAKPDLPVIRSKTHDSMELTLKPLDFGKMFIESYKIEYRCAEDESWMTARTENSNEEVTIKGLKPNSIYEIRYSAVCIPGCSDTSDVLKHVRTHPTSPPEAVKVTATSSTLILHWNEPAVIGNGVTITEYIVEYKHDVENGQQIWIEQKTEKKKEKYIIKELEPMTPYIIRVSAACGDDGLSAPSHEIKVLTHKETESNIKHELLKKSILLKEGKPSVYQLATDLCESQYRQYSLGKVNHLKANKVILLVGSKATGKTMLINGIVNYILGVDWEDDFRFRIEVTTQSKVKIHTSVVTVYQINYEEGYKLPYSLTLIDIPGFRGPQAEYVKMVRNFIYEFFTTDQVDIVGFVVQAPLDNLTYNQKFIFNSVFSIFGTETNIWILTNFSDVERPPVLESIKVADIPCSKDSNGDPIYSKFNNSALFANNQTSDMIFNKMFWDMGKHCMETFFTALTQINNNSPKMCMEVLKERKVLEVTLQALQLQIKAGLIKLDEIRKTKEALQQNREQMKANKDFEFEITVTEPRREDITEDCVTNCQQCNFTCHYPCGIAEDCKKDSCVAMTKGYCTICPNKCVWTVHYDLRYRWVYEENKEKRTYEDIKKIYAKTSGENLTTEKIYQELQNEYYAANQEVLHLINKSLNILKHLDEISLRPNTMTTTEYIDLMKKSEKQEAKPGHQKRIQSLSEVLENAMIMEKITMGKPLLPKEKEYHVKFQCDGGRKNVVQTFFKTI
ncbi:uncharacterized protein LOC128661236 [Bombina bombina]|uniref:uncharacterized protein LOC128661236 n=1 Tax=Bombina bombina TaxID=8345 RepID=UPI00235A54D2|nr:uncharacterized protein LOC128661236 [Bombina bombina]